MSDNDITHTEADELQKTHADYFQIAAEGDYVALSFGEQQSEIRPDGTAMPSEVVYDTKVKMTIDSLRGLQQFIDDVLDNGEDDKPPAGPGVQ